MAKSHTSVFTRTKRTFMKVHKVKAENRAVKLEIPPRTIPKDEEALRKRKERQIQLKKKELEEKKKAAEEDRRDRAKKRFALGGNPNASLTCDHNGRPIVVKTLNGNKLNAKKQPSYNFEKVDKSQIKLLKKRQDRKFHKYAQSLFDNYVNPKNIVDDLKLEESDFVDQQNGSNAFGDMSSVLDIKPGVQYNINDKLIKGPEFKLSNKMTIKDYNIIAKSRGKTKFSSIMP